ncbi:substrate-binding periplasmic protein [Gordonia rhizosphera]|uniref:substrate-binding periplasmic protein n=1 Tax=Gordonia rhizosphera TaxID=83341 RepID=UPI0012F62545|nr:transporter substrate-binding domain-containing protein [Gordonia rhizosphera]
MSSGVLKVAAVQQLPSVDVSPNGDVQGIDSTLLPDFAMQACLTIAWQPLAGPAAVSALSEGKVDIGAGGWYKTPARGKVVGQTDTVWYDSPAIVSNSGYRSIESLSGKKIGVVGGSLFEAPIKEAVGDNNVVVFQSIDAVFQELASGRIDAGLGSGAVLTHQVSTRNSDAKVETLSPDARYPKLTSPGEPNYPYTKSNTELGAALNSFITAAREDGTVRDALEQNGLSAPSYFTGPQS